MCITLRKEAAPNFLNRVPSGRIGNWSIPEPFWENNKFFPDKINHRMGIMASEHWDFNPLVAFLLKSRPFASPTMAQWKITTQIRTDSFY
ncbi:hypothetical protein CEXT_415241 [Caerostris extrusa]|uniref:Uncharacterized protein n=1 Tax=Caerostris extrusa TaxID=172846 RepID=A0AAV4MT03_CAEEX|nr:hypothetical protein CEXT_415241 [Caerostris extrusa]